MKNFISIITILLSIFVNSQKLKVNNIQIVDYDIESNNIKINSVSNLDRNGILTIYSDSWDGKNYFEYKLTDEEISKINFLTNTDLESFVKQKKLNKNQFFAGSRRFIKVGNKSLCFIEPFMNEGFLSTVKILNNKIYKHDESAKIPMLSTDFQKIKIEILKRNEIDNYLPGKAVIIQN